jgi:hypothetical protein
MSKIIKFVSVGDNHGDMVDEKSAIELFKFCDKFQPDEIVHLGDGYDLRSIRRGAMGKEADESLVKDVLKGHWFIKRLKPTVYLYGNHEDRLEQILSNTQNGILHDYISDLDADIKSNLRDNGCKKIYPYHAEYGVHRIGPIAYVHGYTCGVRAVEEHAIHYADRHGAVIMGHIHSIQQTNARKFGGAVGFSGGCLCKKQAMGYSKNRLATSKWGTGWTYGYIQGKNWKVWQAHKVGDKFIYSYTDLI